MSMLSRLIDAFEVVMMEGKRSPIHQPGTPQDAWSPAAPRQWRRGIGCMGAAQR